MKLTTTFLVAAGLAVTAIAQEAPPEEEGLAVLPEFASVDANEDGMIDVIEADTLTELLEEQLQVEFEFDAVDNDRNGAINTEEYTSYDEALAEQLGIG